jgi:uncharacterized RDD family membrane protein YckC
VSRAANAPEVGARQGRRAGIVSRLLADGLDLLAVILIGVLLLVVAAGIRALFSRSFEIVTPPQPVLAILAGLLLLGYLAYGWSLNGRTLGKLALGLRAIGIDGDDLSPGRALARAALYLVFPPGLLWAVVSGRNASLQDLALRTAVIHDWGYATSATAPPPPVLGTAATTGPAPTRPADPMNQRSI